MIKKVTMSAAFVMSAAAILIIGVMLVIFPSVLVKFGDSYYFSDGTVNVTVYFYTSVIPVAAADLFLIKLLFNVKRGLVFTHSSIFCLRAIALCCLLEALNSAVASLFYVRSLLIPAVIIAFCAFFMCVVMVVVSYVIAVGADIKNENDLTV